MHFSLFLMQYFPFSFPLFHIFFLHLNFFQANSPLPHHSICIIYITLTFTVKSQPALEITLDICGLWNYSWSQGTYRRTGRLRRISCRSARETGPAASVVVWHIYIVENILLTPKNAFYPRFRCNILLFSAPLFFSRFLHFFQSSHFPHDQSILHNIYP